MKKLKDKFDACYLYTTMLLATPTTNDTRLTSYMQLVVKLSLDSREWGLVELQGQLETRESSGFQGLHVGDLHFFPCGTASMIVGHHLLSGKVVTLDKPLAVLQKYVDEEQSGTPEYRITAFITKKVIFKNRPKPIVSLKAAS